MILVIMGVSGAGKSTIGELLAKRLGWAFEDADTFHPAANRTKMHSGTPLTDADRRPWLSALSLAMHAWEHSGRDVVLACSALKKSYRKILATGLTAIRWIYLSGTPELIAERIAQRAGHFMPPSLLQSQFDALEVPSDAMVVDVSPSPPEIVDEICRRL